MIEKGLFPFKLIFFLVLCKQERNLLVLKIETINTPCFKQKSSHGRKDISYKFRQKNEKIIMKREVRNFIDDLQLVPESSRVYYSNNMMRAKFKPNYLKKYVQKIFKIV